MKHSASYVMQKYKFDNQNLRQNTVKNKIDERMNHIQPYWKASRSSSKKSVSRAKANNSLGMFKELKSHLQRKNDSAVKFIKPKMQTHSRNRGMVKSNTQTNLNFKSNNSLLTHIPVSNQARMSRMPRGANKFVGSELTKALMRLRHKENITKTSTKFTLSTKPENVARNKINRKAGQLERQPLMNVNLPTEGLTSEDNKIVQLDLHDSD